MADSSTTNLSLTLPEEGASTDTWGAKLNTNFSDLDAIFGSGGTAVSMGAISPDSIASALVVSDTGPHAIGGSAANNIQVAVTGSYTSGGASTESFAQLFNTGLTGANGDTGLLAGTRIGNSITTQGNSETIGRVAQLEVFEPGITVGTGDTVTSAATVYVNAAPTEATNNYALWVDAGDSRFDGSIVGSGGVGIDIDSNGMVGLNETANANMTIGLTINQGGNDDQIFALKSSDIAHGLTSAGIHNSETDDLLSIQKNVAATGGVVIQTHREASGTAPTLDLVAIGGDANATPGTKSTSTFGYVTVIASKHDGANGLSNLAADDTAFAVRGRVGGAYRTLFLVDENGDFYYDGADGGAFDEYDDTALLRTLSLATSDPKQVVRSEFDSFLQYNERDLVECGVLGAPVEDGGLVSATQLQRLQTGAIWQLHQRIAELEAML